MRLPAVRRAVNVIAGDLARMPVKAYEYQVDEWSDIGRDPITIALNEQASEYHTATEWKRWTFSQTLLWGNSFTLISRRKLLLHNERVRRCVASGHHPSQDAVQHSTALG